MAIGGGLIRQAVEMQRKQNTRPPDPYKYGQGQQKFLDRTNRMRMGGRYQPGGDPRQQQGTGGKANRQRVQGDAGGGGMLGQLKTMAGGGQPGGGGLPSKLRAGIQGQAGGQGRSGKPNRRTTQQPSQGGGQMFAGGSPGWAGGQGQGFVAGGPDPSGRRPPMIRGGGWGPGSSRGGGGTSGKGNRQTVPGNQSGGMIGRGSMRGRRRGRAPVDPRAKRQQGQRASGRGGLLGGTTASRQRRSGPVKNMQRGAFEGVMR